MVAPIRYRNDAGGRHDRGRPPTLCVHPSAATPQVAALLHGPPRTAEIVHRSRHAVYVRDHGHHLAVLGRDAVAVPCGLQTTWSEVGDVATVVLGDGACEVDGRVLRVRRYVDARVAPLTGAHPLPIDALLADVAAHLPDATPAYAALRADDPTAVDVLLGRGPGLTPLGDDVLAGWLVGRYARGRRDGAVRTAVLAEAARRTTAVSAVLLAHAARGEAVPELRAYVAAPTPASLAALRAVGHTSGTGLALGVALASPPATTAHQRAT